MNNYKSFDIGTILTGTTGISFIDDYSKRYPAGSEVDWSSIANYSNLIQEFVYKNTVISAAKLKVKMQLIDGVEQKIHTRAAQNYDCDYLHYANEPYKLGTHYIFLSVR